ncbi:hypothetical protein [Nocardia sp. NPDC058497]|uniref:hypothetical protein n=1 Tax=Nocardia sp. NPDC058497 TaxID=3346529 RepID=UPI003650C899
MTTTFAPPLVALDTTEQELVVWQVNISPEPMVSRLTGAWVVSHSRSTTNQHLVHGLPSVRYRPIVLPAGVTSSAVINMHATADAVRREIASAEAAFTAEVAGGRKLERPRWPVLPDVTPVNVLALATAIADIAHDWAEFETLRLSRPYLVQCGGPRIRPLPLEESR